ncbi:MAG: hypothetical protein JWO67_5098 [Streptosporangiaceae bacterium]|nr:hypothetical protein [Streptosporangiaceae bacterium]
MRQKRRPDGRRRRTSLGSACAEAPFPPGRTQNEARTGRRSRCSRRRGRGGPGVSGAHPRSCGRTLTMARDLALEHGVREPLPSGGPPIPPVEHAPTVDRQPRPQERAVVVPASEPLALKEPRPRAATVRADDRDPHGGPGPVIFHRYGFADPLRRTPTKTADRSDTDTERNVVTISDDCFCDVCADGGGYRQRLDPTTVFPDTLVGAVFRIDARRSRRHPFRKWSP